MRRIKLGFTLKAWISCDIYASPLAICIGSMCYSVPKPTDIQRASPSWQQTAMQHPWHSTHLRSEGTLQAPTHARVSNYSLEKKKKYLSPLWSRHWRFCKDFNTAWASLAHDFTQAGWRRGGYYFVKCLVFFHIWIISHQYYDFRAFSSGLFT